jgi:hypothetical protein
MASENQIEPINVANNLFESEDESGEDKKLK